MSNKKGFSLLELVLAVALFSLGSFALASMIIDSGISTQTNTDRINSLLYTKEGIEAVFSIRDLNWSNLVDGEYYLDHSSGAWVLATTSNPADYIISDTKYRRAVGIISSSTALYLKEASVNVSWSQNSGRISSTTQNILLSNWQSIINYAGL